MTVQLIVKIRLNWLCYVLQCVAVCCGLWRRVSVCCRVLQCVATWRYLSIDYVMWLGADSWEILDWLCLMTTEMVFENLSIDHVIWLYSKLPWLVSIDTETYTDADTDTDTNKDQVADTDTDTNKDQVADTDTDTDTDTASCQDLSQLTMGWLRLVGSLELQISFAKEPYKRDLYSAKETYTLKEPTNRSHPTCYVTEGWLLRNP